MSWIGCFQFEKADGIGDGRAVFAGFFGDLFLREMEIFGQFLKGVGLLDGIQILALEIFNQRHLQRRFFRHVAHDDRHAAQLSPLRRSPAALARN